MLLSLATASEQPDRDSAARRARRHRRGRLRLRLRWPLLAARAGLALRRRYAPPCPPLGSLRSPPRGSSWPVGWLRSACSLVWFGFVGGFSAPVPPGWGAAAPPPRPGALPRAPRMGLPPHDPHRGPSPQAPRKCVIGNGSLFTFRLRRFFFINKGATPSFCITQHSIFVKLS